MFSDKIEHFTCFTFTGPFHFDIPITIPQPPCQNTEPLTNSTSSPLEPETSTNEDTHQTDRVSC